ncbi:MAG: primosomal protein N [Acetilactobacillus jinshanensis]
MVNWVKGRFGDLVAILHSGLSAGEKYDEWQRIQNGHAKVVVGARSAIFAPLKNLGVIIMDEEHDTSYKQENTPRYQTRSVAKWRGRYHHCPVVLGSATPSLESRARATKHVYHLLRLPHRINHQSLPTVHIIDMRKEIIKRHETNYSLALLNAIKLRLKRHEQVVLMLNRRGYSNFVMCQNCGYVPQCPNCDISLTFHWYTHSLRCHYCGHEEPVPRVCPKCGSHKIRHFGSGTEQAELELERLIPGVKVVRMDVDTTSRKGAHARLLHEFGSGHANVLLGTQMIAKGLDFPNVTLVGVLNADTSLMLPDFRSAERTFQLLTQVSGRAGRAKKKGEVFIQTFNPDNYAIRLAQQQNYEKFYLIEMTRRHELNYPPYYFTVRLTASSKNRRLAMASMFSIKRYLVSHLSPTTIILGPAPSAITRIKQRYYFQMVIKYKYEPNLQKSLDYVLNHFQMGVRRGLYISIDPDPVNFM